jgi:hypothetical protein
MLMAIIIQENNVSISKVIKIVNYHIHRNQVAYQSHRKIVIEKFRSDQKKDPDLEDINSLQLTL